MRRISASNLRFFSVVYVYVHFRRKSRALLELLAFEPFYFAGSSWGGTTGAYFGVELAFFLGRVRLCTFPSKKPRSS